MNELDKNIVRFVKKHHVFNLAVGNHDTIWTASCFYAFWNEKNAFVFLSDEETLHATIMMQNNVVAGCIALETRIIGKIQGLQFKGIVEKAKNESLAMAKKIYYKRFPYALGTQSTFWILTMQYAKFTDNRLGFGKKIIWQINKTEKPILQ